MLNFQHDFEFSQQRSQQRLHKADRILGKMVVRRILAFALYLLGANFQAIAQILVIRQNTVKSLLRRTWSEGLVAFEDRRRSLSTFLPETGATVLNLRPTPTINVGDEFINVKWTDSETLQLPKKNTLQCRTVLLTLLTANILSRDMVARALGLSPERTRKLKTALLNKDVTALIDQRRGQQCDYRVTPQIKAEVIQQFFLNVSRTVSTSSEQLSSDLKERCLVDIEPRTIRLHLAKLGLPEIRDTLPELLQTVKKTQESDHRSS